MKRRAIIGRLSAPWSQSRNRLSGFLLSRFLSFATLVGGPAGRECSTLDTCQQEEAMYATIRRYSSKTAASQQTIDDFARRVEEKFVPTLSDIRGFHSYAILRSGDKEMVSITFCEDRQGAAESTRRAAEFVQKDPLKDQLSKPEVIEGELLVLKESGVGAR
jgi:hypothetical protein